MSPALWPLGKPSMVIQYSGSCLSVLASLFCFSSQTGDFFSMMLRSSIRKMLPEAAKYLSLRLLSFTWKHYSPEVLQTDGLGVSLKSSQRVVDFTRPKLWATHSIIFSNVKLPWCSFVLSSM